MVQHRYYYYSSRKFRYTAWLIAIIGTPASIFLLGTAIASTLDIDDNTSRTAAVLLWVAAALIGGVTATACCAFDRQKRYNQRSVKPRLEIWKRLLDEMVHCPESRFYQWPPLLQVELTVIVEQNPDLIVNIARAREPFMLV